MHGPLSPSDALKDPEISEYFHNLTASSERNFSQEGKVHHGHGMKQEQQQQHIQSQDLGAVFAKLQIGGGGTKDAAASSLHPQGIVELKKKV